MIVYQLVNEYKRFSEVEAIALAGSGASGRKDNYSDIDIDIIVSKEIDNDRREQIIKKVSDCKLDTQSRYIPEGNGKAGKKIHKNDEI